MQLLDGQPVYSATDLVGFLACEHLTELERAAMAGLVERPDRPDPELDVIRRRGEQHELRYLAELEAEGRLIVRVERRDGEERLERIIRQRDETISAMNAGADVVYQATFFDGRWLGYADFLLKVPSPEGKSTWRTYQYEVADTKLARHVKASAVLQICSYVDQLESIQGVLPECMRVVLGGGSRPVAELRTSDYMAYYRAAKQRFEMAVLGADDLPPAPPTYPPAGTYPEPVEHCDVCRWSEMCAVRRRADDHLSLVAGITGRQRKALMARELITVTRLAAAPIPFDPPLDGTSAASIERVREQARIQIEGRELPKPIYELLLPKPNEPIEPERGLAILPDPNPGDLFFDIEGDPYALEDGIDYLFGVLDVEGTFTAIWSFDPAQPDEVSLAGEKAAFERLMDVFTDRLERFPGMHIYHYAQYEPTHLKLLMGRHATREAEVDRLLRGGKLIDLFRAVRQGLRASVESYSIKKIEPLYGFERSIDLRDAGSSIVAFEEWLQLGEGQRPASGILERIANYNRDDVVSNAMLRTWLEALRIELGWRTNQEVPRPAAVSADAPEHLLQSDAEVRAVADQLTAGISDDRVQRDDEEQGRWLLAQLLPWHRRESKSTFWEFFYRMGLTPDELVDDKGALGRLELIGQIGEPWRAGAKGRGDLLRTWQYRYPPQEYDINSRSELYDPRLRQEQPGSPWNAWSIKARVLRFDDARGTLDLGWPADSEPRHPDAIVPLNFIRDAEQRASLLRLGAWVVEHGVDAPGAWRAGRDLLLGRPPRYGPPAGEDLRHPGESGLDAACRLVTSLDAGTLAIQGPPGSGKTYAGAHMIVRLLQAGKRVGISANSHKVIGHFLGKIHDAAAGQHADVRAVQKISEDGQGVDGGLAVVTKDNAKARDGLRRGDFNVGAGTPWLWASDKSDDLVDVLFVDEAGQMSLANVLAMAGSARSLVLLGDPQQLAQPLQGSHPPGADQSALGHFLAGEDTMPRGKGLFLEHTWRLHPAIQAYTSEAFYEGRLKSAPDLDRQELSRAPRPLQGAGLRFLAADHVGADSESPEEARQVAAVVRTMVESRSIWVDKDGVPRPIRYEDVLVVAPYNAQVGAILRELPDAKVGTVDKFQGQEAPISIYSMTTSSPEDAPRGMDFLYSRNRLNVATSRARCVAVVVASPEVLRVRARTPAQMRLANALCLFVEMAGQAGGGSATGAAQ